jgi:hypothetical protein
VRPLEVTPRVRSRGDRAGDPLDGLVNLFDLGIVLAVAFLLAALSSLQLTDLLLADSAAPGQTAGAPAGGAPGGQVRQLELTPNEVQGNGRPVGQVYELPDGRRVYVESP